MEVLWFDRLMAAAWWIAAIIAGPLSVAGFFVGGWLILGFLWVWWANMDVKNPFKRSTDSRDSSRPVRHNQVRRVREVAEQFDLDLRSGSRQSPQAQPSSPASPQATAEPPIPQERHSPHTTRDTDADSESQSRAGRTDPGTEQQTLPLEFPPPASSDEAGEADLPR